ncbi:amino acid permease [Gautieria morchelliformis]|nr:amino acid permease [Gautieria morchelliformis]
MEEKGYRDSSESHGDGQGLKRQLKSRHIAMIRSAFSASVIGTGLFLGTAGALKNGGPIGLLLGYIVMGTICYSVMISLGEMIAFLPIPGGHIKLGERFVNRAFSFAMGWNYWYNWTIVLPTELSAAAILINFWNKSVNNAVWVTIFLLVVVVINLMGAGVYGECEFIFASIKVIAIIGLIILGIVLDLGGGPNHDRLGFRYWKNPGPFVQLNNMAGAKGQFLGWWAVMTQAAFSFVGTEIVAIAAGEAKNPRKNLPKAIKRVYIRILLFYRISRAGIKGLPSVINACLLTSAWSAASSDLFTSSRALCTLLFFTYTLKSGLPVASVTFSASFGFLGRIQTDSGKVFGCRLRGGLMTWFGISLTYLRFYAGLKAQGIPRENLLFASPLQPYAAWYSMIATFVICFFSGNAVFFKGAWETDVFITNYLPLMLFPVLYIGARLWYKQGPISPQDMDFVTGLDAIEADTYDEPPPNNAWEKFWAWLRPSEVLLDFLFKVSSAAWPVPNVDSTLR